jgi:hypothetical protein
MANETLIIASLTRDICWTTIPVRGSKNGTEKPQVKRLYQLDLP